MPNFYCEYCGGKFPDPRNLTIQNCMRHPNGALKGKHKLYEGGEKSSYICKYCGNSFNSIKTMILQNCMRHPNGALKGKHEPAL
ncbi:hypothetical protein [Brachyspira aalborgi]|uniref:C2H2-type domain-containing protein n=1 Tax=Brachyspira aalborgi TaxID=29522 RepID=A0A5C8FQP1_9SPIR|nr:hypothetical protein [Brachyspira aalborgi]TXJ51885.1 hypothetical protein EPJ84_03830 [Brachyspira aalborgi]